MAVGSASLYAPYTSGSSAATTKRGPPRTDMYSRLRGNDPPEADLGRTGVWGIRKMCLMNETSTLLRLVRAADRGVQRGEAPLRLFFPPRLGDIGVEQPRWEPKHG